MLSPSDSGGVMGGTIVADAHDEPRSLVWMKSDADSPV